MTLRFAGLASPKDIKYLRWTIEGAQIFSTCSKAQYMAIITDANERVVGTGYNGGPKGMEHCNEGGCPRALSGVPSGTDYDNGPGFCIAIHAEQNALIHSEWTSCQGGTIYVNGTPCMTCARLISNSGLARVVHFSDDRPTEPVKFMERVGLYVIGISGSKLFD